MTKRKQSKRRRLDSSGTLDRKKGKAKPVSRTEQGLSGGGSSSGRRGISSPAGSRPRKQRKRALDRAQHNDSKAGRYPKPGPIGGGLIRQLIGHLRAHGRSLPLKTSHILIATSAGSDSLALAHLLIHYGRRVGERSKILLLHVNHCWRGAESDADAAFVRKCGKRWGVPVIIKKAAPPTQAEKGQSLEEHARSERKRIFADEAAKRKAVVLTAHQAEDLAETLLWRLFTGASLSHGGGIAVEHGVELRPLLRIRKRELRGYLEEEGESWREDYTNHDARFLRGRMRLELVPVIESLFPRAIDHLVEAGLRAQLTTPQSEGFDPGILFQAAGIRYQKTHWEYLNRTLASGEQPIQSSGEIHLAGGWRLKREGQETGSDSARWILEKVNRERPSVSKKLKKTDKFQQA